MKKLIGIFCLLYCLGMLGCSSDTSTSTPATATEAPTQKQPQNVVATPSDISTPSVATNNFERIQGDWRNVAEFREKLQIRGKTFIKITDMPKGESKDSQPLSIVISCNGPQSMDGEFLMVGAGLCYKILKVDLENLELELVEQQQVTVYKRF